MGTRTTIWPAVNCVPCPNCTGLLILSTDARTNWIREGQREIARERRETRREVRRELRYGRWDRDRDRTGEIIAGVALGAVIVAITRGVAPPPPAADLCWYWSDSNLELGYWDRCGGYAGF